jgi:hypothetical protein
MQAGQRFARFLPACSPTPPRELFFRRETQGRSPDFREQKAGIVIAAHCTAALRTT